ncbi:TPA: nucleotidyltransferase [bacterium]|jgi:hypothetical protein|nr:nucleotidyltransferase [bacterium]
MKLADLENIIKEHKNDLKQNFRVKDIGIFGSYARNEQKDNSDVDILVELDEPVSLLGLVRLENYLSDLLNIKADIIPKNDIRPELRDNILEETIYL